MGNDKDEELSKNRHDNNGTRSSIVLPFFLCFNVIFITAILIVAALWASVRNKTDMELIPAPNGDRSICLPTQVSGEKCQKVQPEKYLSEAIEKNIRKSQMQYMAEKLNYANVVCRKTTPAVYLFNYLKGSAGENLIWRDNTDKKYSQGNSIKYDISTGLVEILKTGTFFVYSQITESIENAIHNGTLLTLFVKSNRRQEKILESISGECNMVSALSKRSHYVGSAFQLMAGDFLFASHSQPSKILKLDSFLGIRKLG